ncbi:MAG: PIN domain nuclease [Anaerolineae bacterium]|nr:PIN domain nuclease [Anaerolineae bacterium]
MSFEFFVRLAGMVVLAFGGLQLGVRMAQLAGNPPEISALVMSLVGALSGLILTPHLTTRPIRALSERINQLPAQQLVSGVVGLILGLIVAVLFSLPLSMLPRPYGMIAPILTALLFGYIGMAALTTRRKDVFEIFRGHIPNISLGKADEGLTPSRQILLDTSVIIDGRIADISKTGFIMGPMLVPNFVLNEIQHIADSPEALRRNRGRRGLDILNRLQKEALVPVRITDIDAEGVEAVDDKLVHLAKQLGCAILTNDFNLNRVAELQGVLVLNVNDLANAVKTAYLPGEEIDIKVIQEGKELGQGIGYLEDGTMIVIESGHKHLNEVIKITVTKVLQTSAGRMIFARPSADS